MTYVIDILKDSLEIAKIIAAGETPDAINTNTSLRALNRMLDSWNTERLTVLTMENNVFTFVAGQQIYTMGTGGDFNVPRPVRIEKAVLRTAQDYDIQEVEILDYKDYATITAKFLKSTFPLAMYDDQAFPLKKLYFYPVPQDISYRLVLWYWQQFLDIPDSSAQVNLAPGYQSAITYNLAIELGAIYSKPASPAIEKLADQSKRRIKEINLEPIVSNLDPAYIMNIKKLGGYWDWRIGANRPQY